MTKANKQTEAKVDHIAEMMKISDTSKKIRYLLSNGYAVKDIYNAFKGRVTTKNGGEIRYQHVRNVAITPLTSK